jgi:hypothetical protein
MSAHRLSDVRHSQLLGRSSFLPTRRLPRPLRQSAVTHQGSGPWNNLRNANQPMRVLLSSLPRGDSKMTRHDWELLDKQLGTATSPPRQSTTTIGLMIVAVFLVGIGIGDILSKSKQANTNTAAMVTAMMRDGGEIVSSGL